tara:strand:- start:407 stop:1798 length:1392 start_codon:yes stop_codon:yes gene_type:complete
MASPVIKIKRSAVQGNAPTVAQLELGELALNTYDGKLYTEINTGSASIVEIGSNLNTLQVNTITSNVSFTADATFTGDDYNVVWDKSDSSLEFADNAKAVFGAGSDLSIYHTGSHSFIDDTGTGNLKVRSNNFRISNGDESKLYGAFTPTTVELYNNNTKRFETTSIGVNVTGHSELDNLKSVGIATFTNNAIHANVYSTGISTISGFRFPTSDGDEDQALVTDGNGSLSFKTLSGGGGGAAGAATTISSGITTATQGQTVFSTPHPHNDGSNTYSTQVFVNGVKQRPQGAGNATKDFTTSSNSTVTFEEGLSVGDEFVSIVYFGHTIDEEYFTATQGQVLFPLTGSLSAQKNFRVFVNGIKQRNGSDYGVAAPVSLVVPCAEGAHVEIVCDNAEDAFVATDQQTNFTPTSTDISEDNMQVYVNGVQLFKGLDYTIGSPSVTFTDASGLTVGDEVDVCIRRTA